MLHYHAGLFTFTLARRRDCAPHRQQNATPQLPREAAAHFIFRFSGRATNIITASAHMVKWPIMRPACAAARDATEMPCHRHSPHFHIDNAAILDAQQRVITRGGFSRRVKAALKSLDASTASSGAAFTQRRRIADDAERHTGRAMLGFLRQRHRPLFCERAIPPISFANRR